MSTGKGGKLGYPFIPIPVAIYRRRDLTLIDKMLVGRILSFGAASCFLSQQKFADELGVARTYINARLKALAGKGKDKDAISPPVIEAKRGRYGKSYRVVADVNYSRHLEGEMSSTADTQMSTTVDFRCQLQSTQEDVLEEFKEEESSSGFSSTVAREKNDDDEPTFSEKKKTENLDALVSVARDQLRMARAESLGVPVEQVQRPDRAITSKILSVFSDGADFETWLVGTIQRGVARKAKDNARWGLYATDAKTQAEGIAAERVKKQKRRADEETAAEQRRAVEAERQRIASTPVAPDWAISTAKREIEIPAVLQRHLMRLGQPITPATVIEMVRKYRPHLGCDETGMMGYAVDGTLRFCNCLEGQELQHEDPERPAREIEGVHTSLKNKLVATALKVAGPHLADAIETSEITETPEVITFDAPKGYRLYFREQLFVAVLEAAGETRAVRLKWQEAA
jgi:hypothetical protein